jgi:DNA topoisomerase VI subunit B
VTELEEIQQAVRDLARGLNEFADAVRRNMEEPQAARRAAENLATVAGRVAFKMK